MAHSEHAERERDGLAEVRRMTFWWTVGMVAFVAFLFALGMFVSI